MSGGARCVVCGELMPDGEEMFRMYGYSGPCPKPPRPRLLPYQQRVMVERDELNTRLESLIAFLGSSVFAGLDAAEKDRLQCQAVHMRAYRDVLNERIAAFLPRSGER